MLHWCSLSGWGNEDILHCFDYKGSQYIVYARHWHSDNLRCIAKYRWRSVDTHFQKRAVTVQHTFLPIKAANTPLITVSNNSQLRLVMMQNQKLLTLRWRSFSEGGSDRTVYIFADKGCQYAAYNSVQQFTTQITNEAKPKIVDTPLTLIFRRAHWPYRTPFCR
jgi:hypothetical protein